MGTSTSKGGSFRKGGKKTPTSNNNTNATSGGGGNDTSEESGTVDISRILPSPTTPVSPSHDESLRGAADAISFRGLRLDLVIKLIHEDSRKVIMDLGSQKAKTLMESLPTPPPLDATWTTEQFCAQVVIPLTKNGNNFHTFFEGTPYLSDRDFKGVFVSQARGCNFKGLLQVMCDFFPKPEETFVWLDVFAVSQEKWGTLDEDVRALWLGTGLHKAVASFDDCVVWFDRWSEPTPLKRGWCVWESFGAAKAGKPVRVMLSVSEKESLIKSLVQSDSREYVTGNQYVLGKFTSLDARKSECWIASDREMIHRAIADSVGFEHLNDVMIEQVKTWIKGAVLAEWKKMKKEGRTGTMEEILLCEQGGNLLFKWLELDTAEKLHEGARLCIKKHIEPDSDGYRMGVALDNVCLLARKQGDIKRAHEAVEQALVLKIQFMGEASTSVAISRHNKSRVLYEMGMLQPARELIEASIAAKIATYGHEMDPRVALGTFRLAEILVAMDLLDEAVVQFARTEAIFSKTLGNDSHEVAHALQGLAVVDTIRGENVKAIKTFEDTLGTTRIAWGGAHFRVAWVLHHMASARRYTVMDMGDPAKTADAQKASLDRGVREARQAIEIYTRRGLFHHYSLIRLRITLSRLLRSRAERAGGQQVNPVDASESLVEANLAVKLGEQIFGQQSSTMAEPYQALAAAYLCNEDFDSAKEYADKAFMLANSTLGENHRTTKRCARMVKEVNEKMEE